MNAWNNMTFFVEDFSYMPALLTQPGGLPPKPRWKRFKHCLISSTTN